MSCRGSSHLFAFLSRGHLQSPRCHRCLQSPALIRCYRESYNFCIPCFRQHQICIPSRHQVEIIPFSSHEPLQVPLSGSKRQGGPGTGPGKGPGKGPDQPKETKKSRQTGPDLNLSLQLGGTKGGPSRHARRVCVGGHPPTANEQSAATFFSQVMSAVGGNLLGQAVVNVYINHEKNFAFVEMRTIEEASNAMALDGIILEVIHYLLLSLDGVPVKVKRPTDYNPSLAAALGPSQPNPNLNLAAVGFSSGSTGGLEGPDRLFVGGIPYHLTEDQIRELLESFGPLRGFNLVKDRETGNSMGYAFCVFQDPSVSDMACAALNGIKMGDKTLTVRRAVQGGVQPKPEQKDRLLHTKQQIALQRLMLQPGGTPTKIVCLTHVVTANVLGDDKEYEEIMEDMRQEGGKLGNLVNVVIPRPNPEHDPTPGVEKVFLEYADLDGASKARSGMNGRKFRGNQVVAVYYPENKYAQGDYEGY
ncbi:unnamed protein product [Brassica oleracea]